jgi:hypothetical protein
MSNLLSDVKSYGSITLCIRPLLQAKFVVGLLRGEPQRPGGAEEGQGAPHGEAAAALGARAAVLAAGGASPRGAH